MGAAPPAEALFRELLESLRAIDRGSLAAMEQPESREAEAMHRRRLWSRCAAIGRELQALGGLDLMHEAVGRARGLSPRRSDQLEEAWLSIPGYEKRRFLP